MESAMSSLCLENLPVSSLEELGWLQDRPLGQGSFGKVWKLRRKEGPEVAVVKQIRMSRCSDKSRDLVRKEIQLLRRLRHLNIVAYRDSFLDSSRNVNIIMELCEGGDLQHKVGKISDESGFWCYVIQIFQGIKFLHDNLVLHRDIKPSNILINAAGDVQIADLGLSKTLRDTGDFAETRCGTLVYEAPEMFEAKCCYNSSCDIWAVGITIFELATGVLPFDGNTTVELMAKIRTGSTPPLGEKHSPELGFLVERLLRKKAEERPSASQVFEFQPVRLRVELAVLARLKSLGRQDGDTESSPSKTTAVSCETLALENEQLRCKLQKYKCMAKALYAELKPARPKQ
eukprot:RCo004555